MFLQTLQCHSTHEMENEKAMIIITNCGYFRDNSRRLNMKDLFFGVYLDDESG